MVQRRYFMIVVALLAAGLIVQQHCVCGQRTVEPACGQNSKTAKPGRTNTYICMVDATSPLTLFKARGGINCDTSVVRGSTGNPLVGGCRNDAGELALVFNGTTNGRMGTIQFTLRVTDSTITNTCVTCSDGNEILGKVLITGGRKAICAGDLESINICTVNDTVSYAVFTAKGNFNCTRARTVRGSSSLLDGCTNDANQLVLKFNGTAGDRNGTVQFSLSVVDSTITNTLVICKVGEEVLGEVLIAGSPSAPSINVTFAEGNRQFTFQWSSTSGVGVDGYQMIIPDLTGLSCDNSSVDANRLYTCSNWTDSAFGKNYTFRVSASNCRSHMEQVGPSSEVTIRLQVPGVATLTLTPVYDQSAGRLLRIESRCNTLPSVTIAETLDSTLEVKPTCYHFTYSGGTTPVTQTVESSVCMERECRDVFTVSGDTPPQYAVSAVVENVVGKGQSSVSQSISATNDFLELTTDVNSKTVVCRFLGGFTGTAKCQIEYSTQEDLSGSVVDTGSSTNGDTVTVTITAMLEGSTTYYYLVTATAEGVSVRVQDVLEIQGDVSTPTSGSITLGDGATMSSPTAGSSNICYTTMLMIACTLLSCCI